MSDQSQLPDVPDEVWADQYVEKITKPVQDIIKAPYEDPHNPEPYTRYAFLPCVAFCRIYLKQLRRVDRFDGLAKGNLPPVSYLSEPLILKAFRTELSRSHPFAVRQAGMNAELTSDPNWNDWRKLIYSAWHDLEEAWATISQPEWVERFRDSVSSHQGGISFTNDRILLKHDSFPQNSNFSDPEMDSFYPIWNLLHKTLIESAFVDVMYIVATSGLQGPVNQESLEVVIAKYQTIMKHAETKFIDKEECLSWSDTTKTYYQKLMKELIGKAILEDSKLLSQSLGTVKQCKY
ncbi:hypothetical protein BJ508DRAFT_332230 [Ascobolus immersus RN42]|uniref:Uncharacterized protein n=1 Tax=Ascobolus immersus RN42 TaxID=1160509 RepID=A0A3N4HTM3_ASCIM|nr:hypothetical protein BJ508DRAFT_332230 [Ascobolus immersus RN42]